MPTRENTLAVGTQRLGWLASEDPSIGEVPCTLTDTGTRIEIAIEWLGFASIFERWLSGDSTLWGDDPDKTRYRYSVPDVLWFFDNAGRVTLVGCSALGYTSGATGGIGRINVRRAVFGGRSGVDYRRIHALRSDIPGLSQWMNLRSLSFQREDDESGRLTSLRIDLMSPSPTPITRTLNLLIRPSFGFHLSAHGDTSEISERVYVETSLKRLEDWTTHEQAHNDLRELVSIAAWRQFGIRRTLVQRHDDPERVMSGEPVGPRWATMMTRSRKQWPEPEGPLRFLFTFSDIGVAGVRKWIRLRKAFERGVPAILDTLGLNETALEIQVAQAGIGLDGIGYQLALDQGVSPSKANGENHETRLLRVATDLSIQPPFSISDWAKDSAAAYNAVKHANRLMPSHLDLVETRRRHQLVFRYWVAARVGTAKSKLADFLKYDPMAKPYKTSAV